MAKTLPVRLDYVLSEQVGAIAEVENRTVSDVMREAVALLVTTMSQDSEFRKKVATYLAKQDEAIRKLTEPPSLDPPFSM